MGKRKKISPEESAKLLRAQFAQVRSKLDEFEAELDERFPIATPRRSVKAILQTACGKAVSAGRKLLQSRALLIIVFGVGLALGASL